MKKEFNITCMNKVRRIMEIFGGKWVFIVIGQLSLGTKRFNDLVGELNITPRQLSDVLKHLEANEIVDLKDFSLPILGEADPNNGIARWKEKLSELDGYIFALDEYNHSVPGVLKNALDYVGTEMANKAAAIVSYGAAGGARSAEHLRAIFGQTNTADINTHVLLSLFYHFENFTTFKPLDIHGTNLDQLFKSLDAWSKALQTIR